MIFTHMIAGVAGAAALMLGASTGAQEAPVIDRDGEARGVAQAVMAAELARWGRERRDPGALIMASRVLAEVPVRPGGDAPMLSPDALLDQAETFAAGSQGVLDAIARLRSGTRGVINSPFGRGPVFTVKQIEPRETYWFEVEARGGEVLRIAAIGDGDTNIDLTVRDAAGTLVCRDGFGDHYPVCTTHPRADGRMRVDIVNRGDVWTRVQILSN
ncbi:MAG TPA: hypothetical protein PLQ03_03365 [Brevundimonas sp.]|uniref:hypothetical protein n=1 Tax=Brevundimonas sp. TaxID=1871086 RepID=UPI002629CBE6|nr:hypothetical protein [Brevundimonas sp.]HRO32429.1 hypothetical protein [Brevundimonas sp.]